MMENQTIQTIVQRRSVKKYKSDPIKKEILDEIIKAGTYAATGRNAQSPIILAITNKQVRDQLSKLNAKILGNEEVDPFYGAPVVLVVLSKKSVNTHVYDGSLVMGNLMLAASSFGVGSCWIHRAKEEFELPEGKKILQELGIEEEYEGIGHCVLGYADVEPTEKPRKENWVYYID